MTDTDSVFAIHGTVVDPEGKPRPGIQLVATDVIVDHASVAQILVSATSDNRGRFSLPLSAEQALRLFRTGLARESVNERPLASKSQTLSVVAYADGIVVGRIDVAVTLDGLVRGHEVLVRTTLRGTEVSHHRAPLQVTGIVRDTTGCAVAGRRVEVVRVQIRSVVPLANTTSGSDGSFRLSYDPTSQLDKGTKAIAVAVRVLTLANGGRWIEQARSERRCPAPRTWDVALVVPNAPDRSTELDRVAAAVNARRGSLSWTELTDDDIELIACETQLDLSQVTAYVRAARLAEREQLPVAAFYALARRGVAPSVATIGALPTDVVQRELEGAAAKGVVPAWSEVNAIADKLAASMRSRAAADDAEAPLGMLLATGGLPKDVRERFVAGYVGRKGTTAEFWREFEASHSAEDVARVRFSLVTGAMTNGHLPLVAELERRRQRGEFRSARELARLTASDWHRMVAGSGSRTGTGAPAQYPGDGDAERERLYSTTLARAAEEAFPTDALVHRTAKTGRWALAASYVDQHPELDFRAVNARSFLQQHPPTDLTARQQEALRQELSEAQRLFVVAPRFDRDAVAGPLLAAGIHSARQISAMGSAAFVQRFGDALGGRATAKVVYDNAHHVTAKLTVMAARHSAAFNRTTVAAISSSIAPEPDAESDLHGVFGSLDYCECTHCRSVLSPAAYLVDLLHFLEQQPAVPTPAGAGKEPYDVLTARRPDLIQTVLDCGNTNTPLPTIDLVNEILEREVAGITPTAFPQTTRTTEELWAQPEHRLDAAYDVLRNAVFPWSLPFDLARAEADVFLEHLGVSRVELLEVCGAPSPELSDAIARARLGLDAAAARLVSGDMLGHEPHELWGLEAGQWFDSLTEVPVFLRQSGLTFEELRSLTTAEYPSAGQLSVSFGYNSPCRLDGATIVGLSEERLSRIHRFVRLWRAMGWPLQDVDRMVVGVGSEGPDPLGATGLRSIARLTALGQRLSILSRAELMDLVSDLPTVAHDGERSRYEQVFVDVSAQGEVRPLALGTPAVPMSTVVPQLAAALGRSEAEVAAILALDPTRTTTTVANLSWLHRWSILARALKVSIGSLVTLVQLSGIAPMSVLGAAALDGLEALVDLSDAVSRTGVGIADIDGLLRHRGSEPSGISAPAIAALLVELVRALQAVRGELAAAVDDSRPRSAVLAEQIVRVMPEDEAQAVLTAVSTVPHVSPPPEGLSAQPPSSMAFLPVETWQALQNAPAEEDALAQPEQRALLVLDALLPYLRSRLMEGAVVRKLGAALDLSAGAVTGLLSVAGSDGTPRMERFVGAASGLVDAIDFAADAAVLTSPDLAQTLEAGIEGQLPSLAAQLDAIRWLAKAAVLTRQVGLGDDDLAWLNQHGATHGLLVPSQLPTTATAGATSLLGPWLALHGFATFARRHTQGLPALRAVLSADPDDARNRLAAATGWEEPTLPPGQSSILAIANQRGLDANTMRSVAGLEQLGRAFELAERLGVTAARAAQWASATPSTAIARDVQAVAKARVPAARWPSEAGPLRDRLRERQRDALVAYVIAADPMARTPEDLFGRLLIDVQVSPCARTSRIKQALASVQTFVQRVLLDLEPRVGLTAAAAAEWQWMARYRVWEASRKIFLWPENWLEPDLRDDKTELFRRFEGVLLGSELTAQSANDALAVYVNGLEQISQLQIAGMYHERVLGPAETVLIDRLHVFGRTQARPYQYFYRVREREGTWTPWESLPMHIEAECVLPTMLDQRLVLAWVVTQARSKEPQYEPPHQYTELRLLWSVLGQDGWSEVRTAGVVSNDMGLLAENTAGGAGDEELPTTVLRLESASDLFFQVYRTASGSVTIAPGFWAPDLFRLAFPARFRMRTHDGEPALSPSSKTDRVQWDDAPGGPVGGNQSPRMSRPKAMMPRQQWFVVDDRNYTSQERAEIGLQVPVQSPWTGSVRYQRVLTTPGRFTISASSQYQDFSVASPFIYQDQQRSLLLEAVPPTATPPPERNPDLDTMGGLAHVGLLPAKPVASPFVLSGMAPAEDADELSLVGSLAPVVAPSMALDPWERWSFTVSPFDHPLAKRVALLVRLLGVDGVYRPPVDSELADMRVQRVSQDVTHLYGIGNADNTATGAVVDKLEFEALGTYSTYNWELFLHAPMLVALRFMEDGQFSEAQRWMHYVFDPTEGGEGAAPARYWRVAPLADASAVDVEEQLEGLHYAGSDPKKVAARDTTAAQIDEWRSNPFRPHVLARLRVAAYQRWVLMRYLDNLLAWGDHLFAQDTIESNNEAMQLYVLAAQLLGPRPMVLPARSTAPMTYAQARRTLDEFSNFLARGENELAPSNLRRRKVVPVNHASRRVGEMIPRGEALEVGLHIGDPRPTVAQAITQTYLVAAGDLLRPYFCVPHNEELLRYWDRVEDRLFKLRNCLNLQGVARSLPLFDPPIDPGLLARAVAAGVDLSAAINDLRVGLPHYRFSTMINLAKELAAEVRGFGSALVEAMRSADAEALAELRAHQEAELLSTLRETREQRVLEASLGVQSVRRSIEAAEQRRDHYQDLLDDGLLDREVNQTDKLERVIELSSVGTDAETTAAAYASVPQISVGVSAGGPSFSTSAGGEQLATPYRIDASRARMLGEAAQTEGSISGILAGYQRRKQEWTFARDQAIQDVARLEQDLLVAEARIAIAKRELSDHDAQTRNAQQVDAFLRERYTSAELHRWLGSELSRSYFQAYQLTYQIAKQAQRCYQHELGVADASFIQFGYWDNRRKGLLAGERLLHDLRRMETAYLQNNPRELELTKSVSLATLDPAALIVLRETGTCYVRVPEMLFDLDHAGHYMRRLKSVSVSVASKTGPLAEVPMTLTLLSSEIRTSPSTAASALVDDSSSGVQQIATMSAEDDDGLFERSFSDARYLPFEGRGAASTWRIELPSGHRQFDYGSLGDVVLRMSFTARQGGDAFRNEVVVAIDGTIDAYTRHASSLGVGLVAGISVRKVFPDDFDRFLHPPGDETPTLSLDVSERRFPLKFHGGVIRVRRLWLLAAYKNTPPGQALALDLVLPTAADGSTKWTKQGVAINSSLTEETTRIMAAEVLDIPAGDTTPAPTIGTWQLMSTVSAPPVGLEDLVLMVEYTVQASA